MSLPVGGATAPVFGTTPDQTGMPFSNLPPNSDDVDQARVNAAPLLPPVEFSLTNTDPWPSACALTDLKQLEALEPSITGLRGQPKGDKELIDGVEPQALRQPTRCTFNLVTSFDSPTSGSAPSSVTIGLFLVSPRAAASYPNAKRFNDYHMNATTFVDYGDLGNGLSCFYGTVIGLQCDKGDVIFEISGDKIADPDVVAGLNKAVWVDQIEIPLAEVLARELTGT